MFSLPKPPPPPPINLAPGAITLFNPARSADMVDITTYVDLCRKITPRDTPPPTKQESPPREKPKDDFWAKNNPWKK